MGTTRMSDGGVLIIDIPATISPFPPLPKTEDSILDSVKKLIGINVEVTEFDADILMNINAALFTLRQLGVGPEEGYVVSSRDQTYEDYLGVGNEEIPQVRMYLAYKTRLGFDPPVNSFVLTSLEKMIAEAEWRLNVQVDPATSFKREEENSK